MFKRRLVDFIEWAEDEADLLAYRYPMNGRSMRDGAVLLVRDTQLALLAKDGELADLFEPGRHVLSAASTPALRGLSASVPSGDFKSDVYFYSTREQIDRRWGTPNPITVRDKEFGAISLRAHGTYAYRIKNPNPFFRKVSGTKPRFGAQDLDGQLRSIILTSLTSFFGNAAVSFIDMAANQGRFSAALKTALVAPFAEYGLELRSFLVQSVSLPEALQERLEERSAKALLASEPDQGSASSGADGRGTAVALRNLQELLTGGVISQAEFDQKKAELLKKIC